MSLPTNPVVPAIFAYFRHEVRIRMTLRFQWDEAKREANIVKHGIDFVTATAIFDGRPVTHARSRRTDEERFLTVGKLEERLITVVWTWREDSIRLISARRARDQESRRYHLFHE
jgi:uncharacterized DUF497 family protein